MAVANVTPSAPYTPAPSDPDADEFNLTLENYRNGNVRTLDLYGGGPNSVDLTNTTDAPMTIEFRRNDDPNSLTVVVQPGETAAVNLPAEWAGNVRKLVPGENHDAANLAEFSFSNGHVFFDESDETGRNASILMQTPDGTTAGSDQSVLANAPEGTYVYNADGERVLLPSKTNGEAFQWLTETLGADTVYIHSEDHTALRDSASNRLAITFGSA